MLPVPIKVVNLYDSVFEETGTRCTNKIFRTNSRTKVRLRSNNFNSTRPSQDVTQEELSKATNSEAPYVSGSKSTPHQWHTIDPLKAEENTDLSTTTIKHHKPQLIDSDNIVSIASPSANNTLSTANNTLSTCQKGCMNLGTKRGIQRNGKTIRPPCGSTCVYKCFQKFTSQQREHIFNGFWKLSLTKMCEFIANYVNIYNQTYDSEETSNTTYDGFRRKRTFNYFLPLADLGSDSPRKVFVCKTMFLNTLSIGQQTVYTAFSKVCSGDKPISPDH